MTPEVRIEGNRVAFELVSGKAIRLPPSYGTIHDPSGKEIPKCVVYFGPYRKSSRSVEMNRSHRRYFGSDHRAKLAVVGRIPKEGWKVVGKVAMIYYVRKGTRAPGAFHHPFKSRHPTLSKSGRFYKLSLGEGCLVDDRGYVFP